MTTPRTLVVVGHGRSDVFGLASVETHQIKAPRDLKQLLLAGNDGWKILQRDTRSADAPSGWRPP